MFCIVESNFCHSGSHSVDYRICRGGIFEICDMYELKQARSCLKRIFGLAQVNILGVLTVLEDTEKMMTNHEQIGDS